MSNKIGRFEILSEIARSSTTSVYKASDSETSQTVALKTLKLEALGDQAHGVMEQVLQEAEASKVLNSPNIAALYGVGDIDQLLCASMEYVQGNSIATMLARKEGFSIWDLQDIARQTSQGLDHAHAKNVFHYSLEPAKIMVQWDGTVKLLSFGTSTMTAFTAQSSGAAPDVLHYMSPEQLHGDPLDARSNIFTLGAILYEMVTEQKPFAGETAEQVRQQILEATPKAPGEINRKLHPVLNDLIMKALLKSPDQRYQSGQELVSDLEKCKESASNAAAKSSQPAQGLIAPQALKPTPAKPVLGTAPEKPAARESKPLKAAAAAAGVGGSRTITVAKAETAVPASASASASQPKMSAAVAEPEVEAPKIAVDPMMDESGAGAGTRHSFSEIDELPPLKEVYVAPQAEPAAEQPASAGVHAPAAAEKPKMQPRQAAKIAVAEIRKTPPKLFMYAIAAALGVIVFILAVIAFRIHSDNGEESSIPLASATRTSSDAAPSAAEPAAPPQAAVPVQSTPDVPERASAISVKPKYAPKKKVDKAAAPVAPGIVPGQLTVNSTPAGAQVQIDGRSDPAWVTPFNLSGVAPGQHTAVISKSGYVSQTHAIDVGSGHKSFVAVQLAALSAAVSVNSDPAGAVVVLDGKDSGRLTPTQLSVDKPGNHTILVRREGYLEETTTLNLQLGQTVHYSPTLRRLGNTDEIKTVSKFKKVFRSGDAAGMGTVSVKTSPKGAQVAINRRILDKPSPVDFYLNPGTYVVDITLSGFKGVHKVITVEKSGKVVIEENLERE